MDRKDLERLAWQYEMRARKAKGNLERTGQSRYKTASLNAEETAEALRTAAAAAELRVDLILIQKDLRILANRAEQLLENTILNDPLQWRKLLKDVVAAAEYHGLRGEQ